MTLAMGGDHSISILDVLRGIVSRKLLVVSGATLGLLAGLGVLAAFKPAYQAETQILIQNLATPYDEPNVGQATPRDQSIDERAIKSQIAVIESTDLSLRVIDRLNLGATSEFDNMKNGLGGISRLLIAAGFSDDPRPMAAEQRALHRLKNKLTVYSVPNSNVIAIKYVAQSGETAAAVANALAETYVTATRETDAGSNSRARDWLSGQIESLRARVASSDAAVEKFRAEKGLFRSREATIGGQEISELNSQITLAEAAHSEARAKADEIRNLLASKGSVDGSAEVLNSPTIQRLRELQVAAARRVSELSATYLPNHPKMIAAQKDAADVSRQVRREALKIVDGLQGEAKVAAARAESLRASLEILKGRESVSLQDEVRLKELERESKANRDQLELMLARFADSNTRQNLDLQPAIARIIQVAMPPANPYFPRPGPTLLLTTLIGLGTGLGLAFLLEIMRLAARLAVPAATSHHGQAVRSHPLRHTGLHLVPSLEMSAADGSSREAQNMTLLKKRFAGARSTAPDPFLAGMPETLASLPVAATMDEARRTLEILLPAAGGDAFAALCARVLSLMEQGPTKAVAVTGIGKAMESAVTAVALSRLLATAGRRTVLLDLANNSVIPELMGLAPAPGVADLIAGQADFSKVIQSDAQTRLQVIRRGEAIGEANSTLSSRAENMTATLAGIFNAVVVHVGEASPQSLALMRGCCAAAIVAESRRLGDVAPAARTLASHGIGEVVTVLADGAIRAAA